MDKIQHLAQLIGSARTGVAFTGAGMSTESGIADFRSPGGVWSRHKPVDYSDFLSLREERVRYWKMRRELYEEFSIAKPNDGHRALARMEELGKVRAVVTQNIDGLHQDGGSKRVIEIHGTSRVVACISCGKEWTPAETIQRLDDGEDAPDCDECGQPLKSREISFGQSMPEVEIKQSLKLMLEADVCLSIGSSLVVEPAASLPRSARAAGAHLVIINKTETPLDSVADLVIREPIGQTLQEALRLVEAAS